MTDTEPRILGREAFARQAWSAAYAALESADRAQPLDLDDRERLAVAAHMLGRVDDASGRPRLDDGAVLDVANVVWCTGFRPDYGWIAVPGFIGDDGWPKGTRGVVDGAPGLYFLGIPFTYGFTSMLVAGAGRDAAYVVDRIADRAGAGATRSLARAVAAG